MYFLLVRGYKDSKDLPHYSIFGISSQSGTLESTNLVGKDIAQVTIIEF